MSKPGNEISLYERIGGALAITAAVDRFYDRVLADPELKNFFNGVSGSRLKAHQFAFLSQALGGPKQYSGASMRDAHSRLAIEHRHFDGVAVHLVETLRDLGVPDDIIGAIGTALTPLSEQIVNTPAQSAAA
jgi:hemoglobin